MVHYVSYLLAQRGVIGPLGKGIRGPSRGVTASNNRCKRPIAASNNRCYAQIDRCNSIPCANLEAA